MATRSKKDTDGQDTDGREFGVFQKDDARVTAWTVEDAVRYRFDGWEEIVPASPENREPTPDSSTGESTSD